jgi:hypothetical protein
MITIHPCTTSILAGKWRIACTVTDPRSARELWFEVDPAYKSYFTTDSVDAFVVSSVLPAMLSGHDLIVEGAMSKKLFYNLTHSVIPLLKQFFPCSHIIAIRPAEICGSFEQHGDGVMAGFSGGIDSFCNYYDHSGDRAPKEYHITHFVYNNVGSHGQRSSESDHSVFVKRFAILQEFVHQQGKPFIMVNSNLDDMIGRMPFQSTHTVRNAAVALLMQDRICKFLYASTFPFQQTEVKPSHDMAHLDPVMLPLLGTERLECIASGGQHTRVAKTGCVALLEASTQFLDVCTAPPEGVNRKINCSLCWKCLRTELTLAILGKLDQYDRVFDLSVYRRFEKLHLIEVLSSKDYLLQEIADLIKAKKFSIPASVRWAAAFTPRFITRRIASRLIPKLAWRNKILTDLINACLTL